MNDSSYIFKSNCLYVETDPLILKFHMTKEAFDSHLET